MSFASNMKAVSKRMIDKYGSDVILVEVSQGAYNPDTGKADEVTTPHMTKAHISQFDQSLIVAGVVDIKDMKLTLYTETSIIPDSSWHLLIGGVKHEIISIQNIITAQDNIIIYDIQARK